MGTIVSLHLLGHLAAGFFFIQSVIHVLQNNFPHPLHYIGSSTTSLQIMQSNESNGNVGNRYFAYPKEVIFVGIKISLFNYYIIT